MICPPNHQRKILCITSGYEELTCIRRCLGTFSFPRCLEKNIYEKFSIFKRPKIMNREKLKFNITTH